jgi:hypothetical protein
MTINIFSMLTAATFGSAPRYALSGFGFAVLAAPLREHRETGSPCSS